LTQHNFLNGTRNVTMHRYYNNLHSYGITLPARFSVIILISMSHYHYQRHRTLPFINYRLHKYVSGTIYHKYFHLYHKRPIDIIKRRIFQKPQMFLFCTLINNAESLLKIPLSSSQYIYFISGSKKCSTKMH